MKRFKKFDSDDEESRLEYEALLNDPKVEILKEMPSFDKTRGNRLLIAVWWIETGLWDLEKRGA